MYYRKKLMTLSLIIILTISSLFSLQAFAEGVSGDGISGESISGERLSGEGVSGEGLSGEGISGTYKIKKLISTSETSSENMYDIAFNILINGEFNEGENILSRKQIRSMTVKGIIHNLENDKTANISLSSINKMIITVEDGAITQIDFSGTVKTRKGSSDTYNISHSLV